MVLKISIELKDYFFNDELNDETENKSEKKIVMSAMPFM